ncbi:MAG: methylated-DNA--[protein]-cysteine S-methyltransferase [bacterium]
MTEHLLYARIASVFGTIGLVWEEADVGPKVSRVLLPHETNSAGKILLIAGIERFLEGEAVDFDLERIALDRCSEFQRRVLLADFQIPRGWISTYGRIARRVGTPNASRAVGRALARNPFPLVIPCHRVLRSHGGLGGYRGGLAMKQALLQLEGVEFSAAGRVLTDRIYY